MSQGPEPLDASTQPDEHVVDAVRLRAELALGLLAAADAIPAPPEPFSATGSDPLSVALAARIVEVEAPIINGLPILKERARAVAQEILETTRIYSASSPTAGIPPSASALGVNAADADQ